MYVDIKGIHRGNKQRRVYFCYMPYIKTQNYYDNKKLLFENAHTESKFKETEHIIFIPIKNIINSIINIHSRFEEMHETTIMDVTKRSVKVQGTTMRALYTFLKEKNLLEQLLPLNQSLSAGGGRNFFNNWRWWFPRAPQTSKVSIITGSPVPPVSYVPPGSSRTHRSRGTHRAPNPPRTQRAPNPPRTHRSPNSHRTHRAPSSHSLRQPLEPFNVTDTMINAVMKQALQQ